MEVWADAPNSTAFIAQFRSTSGPPTGHDVIRVALTRLRDGRWRGRPSVFATGFANPLAVAADTRGLFVGDWTTGVVYRLRPTRT